MNLRSLRALALHASLAALALPLAAEDLTIVSKLTIGKDKGKELTSTQYISRDKVRTSDGQNDTILEYETGRMVIVNHKEKEYYETSFAEISRQFQELEAQLQGNPMLERMFGGIAEVKVQKGEGTRKVAGYDCEPYSLSMGDALLFDLWVTPALEAPHQYYDARKASYALMGPMGQRFEKMFDEMKKIKGFPLAVDTRIKMMMMKQETLSEATEVKKGEIPASAFELPAGYKKKDSPFKKKG
jgi:hypothetical protein